MHYDDIHRYCLSKTFDKEAADDLTQETFLLLINKSSELVEDNIRAWLYQVAHNMVRKYYTESKNKTEHEQSDAETIDLQYDISNFSLDYELELSEYPDEQIEEIKEKILNSLSPEDKKLYQALYIDNRSHSKIAQELGISTKTANVRAYRLKQKIIKYTKGIFGLISILLALLKINF